MEITLVVLSGFDRDAVPEPHFRGLDFLLVAKEFRGGRALVFKDSTVGDLDHDRLFVQLGQRSRRALGRDVLRFGAILFAILFASARPRESRPPLAG